MARPMPRVAARNHRQLPGKRFHMRDSTPDRPHRAAPRYSSLDDNGSRTPILPNAFIGKLEQPTADELAAALGPAREFWDQLLVRLAAELNLVVEEWNSYSPSPDGRCD